MLAWLSVSSEVQACIWPSGFHCRSLSLASVKSRLVLPFWYRHTRVVPDKGPLNGCVCKLISKCKLLGWLVVLFHRLWASFTNNIRAVEATQALSCHFVCYIACIFTSAYDARPVYITRGCSSVFLRLWACWAWTCLLREARVCKQFAKGVVWTWNVWALNPLPFKLWFQHPNHLLPGHRMGIPYLVVLQTCAISFTHFLTQCVTLLSPRKLSRGIMFLPALVCLCVCLSVCLLPR